jgi:hypothetical protein
MEKKPDVDIPGVPLNTQPLKTLIPQRSKMALPITGTIIYR